MAATAFRLPISAKLLSSCLLSVLLLGTSRADEPATPPAEPASISLTNGVHIQCKTAEGDTDVAKLSLQTKAARTPQSTASCAQGKMTASMPRSMFAHVRKSKNRLMQPWLTKWKNRGRSSMYMKVTGIELVCTLQDKSKENAFSVKYIRGDKSEMLHFGCPDGNDLTVTFPDRLLDQKTPEQ